MSDDSVSPGTPLAYSEELLPGEGTYDDGEQIRAALYGTQRVDPDSMTVSVTPHNDGVPSIEKGDIVIGRVRYMRSDMASVEIIAIRGKEGRSFHNAIEGTLHASKVAKRYVDDMANEMQCGDLIRAKVIGLRGGPQLATDQPDFGVVAAYSPDDNRRLLSVYKGKLKDEETGRIFPRLLANDYGKGRI